MPAQRITFQLHAPEAQAVYVAGDFNHWEPLTGPMRRDEKGIWRITLTLAPHEYEYRFVIDGQWRPDPANPRHRTNYLGVDNIDGSLLRALRMPDEADRRELELYQQGYSKQQIATELGRELRVVRTHITYFESVGVIRPDGTVDWARFV